MQLLLQMIVDITNEMEAIRHGYMSPLLDVVGVSPGTYEFVVINRLYRMVTMDVLDFLQRNKVRQLACAKL